MQHRELNTNLCPWSIDKLFKLIFTYFYNIFIAGKSDSHGVSSINKKWECEETRRVEQRNRKPKWRQLGSTRKLVAWSVRMAAGVQARSGRWKCCRTPRRFQFFSWITFGAARQKCIGKGRNCDICLRTKITRASCRKRTGTVVPRAEHFGDLITADHKVLSEGGYSRNNHRYSVVVQDLATQWIQSYPQENFSGNAEELAKVPGDRRGNQKSFTLTIPSEFGKSCEELSWNHSLYVNAAQIGNKWDCRKSHT